MNVIVYFQNLLIAHLDMTLIIFTQSTRELEGWYK